MSPLFLVLLPTPAEGPMARAELSFARNDSLAGREVELLVEAAGASLRGRLGGDAGVRVEAGCGVRRCRLAVDGFAAGVDAALPLLVSVPAEPAPRLTLRQRQEARRAWRGAWRRPTTVLDAAVRRLAEGTLAPFRERPAFRSTALAARWATGWTQDRRLVVAGDYSPAALTAALVRQDVIHGEPIPPQRKPPSASATANPYAALPLLAVDWPGGSRAQVALVWETDPTDAVRDQAFAGDFESRLVQSLRETWTFTYDVSFDTFDTWASASWDVRPEAAWASLTVALSELWEQGRLEDADSRKAAWQRLLLGRALLADTLPGRIAGSELGPLPPLPSSRSEPPRVLGAAVVGDLLALTPEWRALAAVRTDRCSLLYGADCPPGS